MTQKLQGYGQPQDWDDETYYPVGQSVADRGGIWRALVQNRNSRPISGNTDWTLVAGTPYVDVTLDPVALTTAPFVDSLGTAGLLAIPAPGPGNVLVPLYVYSTTSLGNPWAFSAAPSMYWAVGGITDINLRVQFQLNDALGNDFATQALQVFVDDSTGGFANLSTTGLGLDNVPLVLQTTTDITNGGVTIGTRSVVYRIFYLIAPALAPGASTFFTITAVDQGTKTFTVSPDPTSVIANGNTITVVGSTGNDGTYTVASRDATHIVVVQAIPDATADGWVKKA